MANESEPAKQLLPYLQRADELQKHEPLVAYYCRLYAMERGLKIPQTERTKTTNSLLISIMKQLEKDKKSLKLGPDDSLHLEGFASSVFAKADKQDRAGRADLSTAKTFYAASIFFEVLNQFGELQPDLEQKQKYAVWKAADIRKAIKEGRKPVPGPPGGDTDLSRTSSNEYDIEPSSTDRATKPAPEFDQSHQSYDKVDPQHFSNVLPSPPTNIPQSRASNIPPSHPFPTDDYPSHNFHQPPSTNRSENSNEYPSHNYHQPPPSSRPENSTDNFPSHNYHQPPPSSGPENSTNDYPSHNYHQPPTNRSDDSTYPQPYQHQTYPQEPPQHLPHNYPSHETPSFSYPNFQSYPSFTESSLPTAPSHIPSYYQGSEASYPIPPTSNTTNHQPTAQYNSSGRNGTVSEAAPTSPKSYQYDSNYQPPPEKIAEAHKAARFAVGALAFDDVSIAVDFLKKSLELLTNPSAGE